MVSTRDLRAASQFMVYSCIMTSLAHVSVNGIDSKSISSWRSLKLSRILPEFFVSMAKLPGIAVRNKRNAAIFREVTVYLMQIF